MGYAIAFVVLGLGALVALAYVVALGVGCVLAVLAYADSGARGSQRHVTAKDRTISYGRELEQIAAARRARVMHRNPPR